MTKKILIVSTSATHLKGGETGLWLEELAAPYYVFQEAGYDVAIASPAGGPIPLDRNSLADPFFTEPCKKFMHDAKAVGDLCHSIKLDTIEFPGEYDAIFMPGGHGTCADFINNSALKKAIETMANGEKVVASVCHGPNCFVDCVKADGTPFVQGRTVTGFTDEEEAAVQQVDKVPFLLEAKLKEQGANFERGGCWTSKVCVDGKLITGQNPQSSEAVAAAVVKTLS